MIKCRLIRSDLLIKVSLQMKRLLGGTVLNNASDVNVAEILLYILCTNKWKCPFVMS